MGKSKTIYPSNNTASHSPHPIGRPESGEKPVILLGAIFAV
jgi:hypothetical protein